MKRYFFFIIFFILTSISFAQNDKTNSLVPPSLESAIESVKMKIQDGASKKEIAAIVNRIVADRLTFLNHSFYQRDGSVFVNDEIEKKVKYFNTWREMQDHPSTSFTAYPAIAVWAWENRMGQCDETASVTFHILAMAYESTEEIIPVNLPNHRFVIFGNTNIPSPFSPEDLIKLEDTYIVDPWDGKSFSTKELSFKDVIHYRQGNPQGEGAFRHYMRRYNDWIKKAKDNPVKYQDWLHGTSNFDKNLDKANLEISLELLQEELDRLKTLSDKIIEKGNANHENAKSKLNDVRFNLFQDKKLKDKYEDFYPELVNKGKSLCDEAQKSQDKIQELHTVLKDGEEIIKSRIDQANGRVANCTKNEDAIFVIEKYKESKQAFGILKKGKEGASEILLDIKVNLTHIENINKSIDSINTNINELSEKKSKIIELLKEVKPNLAQLDSGFSEADVLNKELDALELRIKNTELDYIKDFPKSKIKFNELISKTRVSHISYKYDVLDRVELSDLHQNHQKYELASLDLDNGRKRKSRKSHIKCLSIDEAQKKMNKIEEIYFWALLAIKDNEHLSKGCVPKSQDEADEDTTENTQTANTNLPPPTATDSITTKTPEKDTFGGLIIGGPSQITVGKGTQFIALDGGGDPYLNTGSYEWVNTREDLMVLSRSGLSSSALALKPGNATILLKYDGMSAWKDIKIVESEKDSDNTSNDDIENNQHQEQCSELIDFITIFLNSSDVDNARSYTSRAVALGCDVNTGAIYNLIAQIEAKKEEEQKQVENEQRLEADRIKEERRKKRTENLNAFVGLLGETLNSVNDNSNSIPTILPENKRDATCNVVVKSGSIKPEQITIPMSRAYGTFKFEYVTHVAKDRIYITQGSKKLFDSGCVGPGKDVWMTEQVRMSGFGNVIKVIVNPECEKPEPGTEWSFKVNCLD